MTADYSTSFNQDETLSNRFNPDIQTMKCSCKSTYHAFSSDHSPPPLESAPLAALAQYEQWPYLWIPTQHLESWSCQIFCLAGHRQPNPVLDCGNWKQEPEKEGIFWIEQIGDDFLNIKENIRWVPWGLFIKIKGMFIKIRHQCKALSCAPTALRLSQLVTPGGFKPCWTWELDSMILVGPFQLRAFWESLNSKAVFLEHGFGVFLDSELP